MGGGTIARGCLQPQARLTVFAVLSEIHCHALASPSVRFIPEGIDQDFSIGDVEWKLPSSIGKNEHVLLVVEDDHVLEQIGDRVGDLSVFDVSSAKNPCCFCLAILSE